MPDNKYSNNRRKVYDKLSEKYNMGEFSDFENRMKDDKNRRKVYGTLQELGLYNRDYGRFSKAIGYDNYPMTSEDWDAAHGVTQNQDTIQAPVSNVQVPDVQQKPVTPTVESNTQPTEKKGIFSKVGEYLTRKPEQSNELSPWTAKKNEPENKPVTAWTAPEKKNEEDYKTPYSSVEEAYKWRSESDKKTEEGKKAFDQLEKEKDAITKSYFDAFLKSGHTRDIDDKYKPQIESLQNEYYNEAKRLSSVATSQEELDDYLISLENDYNSRLEAVNNDYNSELNERFEEIYGKVVNKDLQGSFDRYYKGVEERNPQLAEDVKQINQKEFEKSLPKEIESLRKRTKQAKTHERITYSPSGFPVKTQANAIETEAANRLLDKTEKLLEASKNGNILTGFKDQITAENWDFGVRDLADNYNLAKVLEKAEKGEEHLTWDEQNLLDASFLNMTANAYLADKVSRGYKMGQVTSESLPFMIEMAANPISRTGSQIAKNLLKWGVGRYATRAAVKAGEEGLGKAFVGAARKGLTRLPKFGANLAGQIGAASGMTATSSQARVLANTFERRNNGYQLTDEGVRNMSDESFGSSLAHGFYTQFGENFSEMMFNALRGLGKMSRGERDLVNKLTRWINPETKAGISNFVNTFYKKPLQSEFAQATQFHGIFEEYLEEVGNNLMGLLSGDTEWKDVTDLNQNLDTFLGLLPTSLVFGVAGGVGLMAQNRQYKRALEDLYNNATDEQRANLAKVMAEGDIKNRLKAVLLLDTSLENKRNLADMLINDELERISSQAIEGLDENSKEIETEQVEAEEAEEQAQQLTPDNYIEARKELSRAQRGFDQQRIASAQERLAQFDQSVQGAVDADFQELGNQETGRFEMAKIGDQEVNITGGRIELDDEGNVDPSRSSEVIYYKGEDGKVMEANPSEFAEPTFVPMDEYFNRKRSEMYGEFNDIPQPQQGQILHLDGTNYAIQSVDPDGMVIAQLDENGEMVEGGITKMPLEDYYSRMEQQEWGEQPSLELTEGAPQAEAQEPTRPEATQAAETPATEAPSTPATSVAEETTATPEAQAPATPAVNIPRDKDGDIDFASINDPETFKAGLEAYSNEEGEDFDEVLEDYISDAQTAVDKAGKIADPAKRRKAVKAAKARMDMLNGIKSERTALAEPVSQEATSVPESTESVPETPVSVPESAESVPNEPESVPEPVAEETESAPEAAEVEPSSNEDVNAAREEVNTEPSDAQKEAGNYKKGHVTIDGLNISIENPKGSTRSGKDQDGNEWSNTMSNDYGYIRKTEGADGDHVDVFLSDNPDEGKVYVIDQNVGGKFDEHKVMYGFNSEQDAREAYLSNYEEGWDGIGAVTEMSKDEFKDWLKNGDQKKPASEYKRADSTMEEYSGIEDGSNTQEMQQRMQDWLNDPDFDWAEAKELDDILNKFGNKLEPIAYIPSDWIGSIYGGEVKDNRIYCSKGYFIDHAVNHHPEIGKEDYNLIQEVLNNPDHVKDLDNGSIAFTKVMDKGYAVVIRMYNENGKIVMHKSFFWNESKEPYKNKKDIEKKSSVGGSSTISHTEVPGSPLSARDDSESKSKEETPNTQENKEKTSENSTEEDSEAVDNTEPEKTETQKAAEAVASKLGLKVKWVDGLIDGIADGKIEGDTVTIQRDAARPIDTLIGHEFTHRMKDKAPKDFKAFQDFIKKNFHNAFMSYRNDYEQRAAMSGVELTDEELDEEATCDFAGFMFHDTNILSEFKKADKSILQQIIDFIDSVIDAIAGNPFVNTGDYSKAREMLVDTIKNAEKNITKEKNEKKAGTDQNKENTSKKPVRSKAGKVTLDTNGGIFVILENGYKLDVNKIDLDSLMWAIYDLGSPKDVATLLSKMFEDKSKKAYKLLQELAKGNYVQGGTNPKEFDTKYASEIIKYVERTLAKKGYNDFVKPIIDKLGDNKSNQRVIETAAAWPHVDYTGENGAIYTSRAEKELATFLLFTHDIDKAYDFFRGNMLTEIGGKAWYMLAMKNGLRGIKEDLGIDKNKFKEYAESLLEGAKSSVEDNGKLTYKMTEAAGQDPLRPILSGIFHSNGYAVATNKHLLFRSRKEYNPEKEGKVIHPDGNEIQGTYPNVSAVIPDVEAEKNKKLITDVDFGLMHRAAKAALRFSSGVKSVTFILPDGSRVTYNAELLEKFTRALLANGVEGRMIVSPTQANYAWSDDFDAIMMPLHAEVGGLVVDMETGKAKFEDFDTGFKSDNVFVGAKGSEPAKRESQSRKVSAEKSAPKEEKSEPKKEKSTPSKDSAKDQKEKMGDVGEKIAGARKDMLREIAKHIADIDVKSLVEHPFAKVYKKPNLAKAVSEGLMREQDARFYEAYFSTYVNTQKPRTDSRDERYKKYYGSSYETKVDKWAKQTHKSLSFLKDFIEADDAEKDRIIKEILSDKFLDEAADMAQLEKMKSWNKDTPTRKYTWGELWTPNPMYVTYQILDKLDYKVGDKLDIPFGIIQSNSSFTGYKLVNQKGNANYGDASSTLDDAIDHAVYLAKLKMGYDNLQHPASDFTVNVTKWNKEETGKYEVSYLTSKSGFSVSTREFDNKEAADEFAKAKSGIVKPVMKATSPAEVEILFRNELTGVRTPLSDKKFQSREDASAYIDENYDELNDAANKTIEKESGSKGKKEVTAKDVVRVYYTYETNYVNGKPEYNSGYTVEIPAEYAFNGGYPRKIAGPFKDKAEATKIADSIRDDVLKTYKEAVAEKRAFVYFSEGSNERLGEDYRSGKDVTADDFMNAFGFRGVQFGNWTDQEDRQMAVNQAYDAFMDLAKLLGVSPEALSLNGELGIAFGSRGSGNFSAHYERDNVVINLTKTRGAGSLAHEWFHALDNYLSRSAGDKFGMVTDKDVRIREELRNAFDAMLREVRGTNFFERSKKMGDYWGRMHEVTARLFAEWVNNELKKSGMRNDFLSRGVDIDRFTRMSYKWYTHTIKKAGYEPVPYEEWINLDMAYSGFPYPNRKELDNLSPLVKGIFDVIEERDENGKKALYSLVGPLGLSRLDTPVAGQILNDLEVAKTLDKTGATAKEIHLTTSWSKGADGKWRFEAPDMEFSKEAFDSKKELTPYKLTDIIENKDVLKEYEKMYPRLSDTDVVFVRKEDLGNSYGSYSHTDNSILLRSDLDIWDSASVLAHELQHLIQHEEGFASGGSLFSAVSNDVLELSDKLGEAIMKRNSGDVSPEYVERIREQLNNARNNAYNRLSGEVEARNVGDRYFHDEKWKKSHTPEETEDTQRDLQIIQSLPESLSVTKYSLVGDKKTLDWFNKAPKIETYKGMVLMPDGSLASPMADTLNKPGDKKNTLVKSDRLKVGDLHKSDEHPDIVVKIAKGNDGVDYGHVQINKPDGDPTGVAYNPYDHTSDWMLNDQFEGAWMRDDMVVVKFEVTPEEWKKDKPYRAILAKDPVGPAEWKKGVVGRTISGPNARKVYLTQYSRPVGIASMDEFVANVREKVGKETPIPFNVVNSAQREALYNAGFNISEPTNSGSGNASRSQYDEWKQSHPDRIPTFEAARETGETIGTKVKMSIASPYGDNVKAWSKDGEIFVNPLNVSNENDATRLVLTEAVAGKKLSGLLGKSYEGAINDIWKALPDDVILSIFNAGNGVYDGVMDYMANIAEGDKRPAYWNAVKSALNSAFAKEGIDVSLSDNDARYLFWRSQLTGTPFEITVKDTAMRLKLGIDENPEDDGPGGGRYSIPDSEPAEDVQGESSRQQARYSVTDKAGTLDVGRDGMGVLSAINKAFNEELAQHEKKHFAPDHAFELGYPSGILRYAGVEDMPIQITAGIIDKKKDPNYKSNHPFEYEDIADLPVAIQHPIAVFNSPNMAGSKIIMTELKDSRGKNFVAFLELGPIKVAKRRILNVNNITSVFPKDSNIGLAKLFVERDENGEYLCKWADIKKSSQWLADNGTYFHLVGYPMRTATNVIHSFDNAQNLENNLRYSLPSTDSEGGNLTDAQREYFRNSKAVDKDGNLLVLYHGTPYAGFNTFRGGWFTTSKKDADSYGGNHEGALYDPEEKGGSKTLTAGDFKVGYMTFDSKEDADDFKKAHPLAEEAMTIDKLDEAIDNAEWEGDDELAGSLESKREDFKKIAKDYREYEFAHMVDSSWNDLLSNPEAYTLDDFKRAFLAFDSNAFFDDLDDMDSDEERKDALIEAMHYVMDEGDASAESWNGLTFKTRVPRNGSGISKKDLNRRTYKVYANIKNPAILDANGRHSEFESGDIYDAIKEERAKGVHDGVIVNNWRVGRYQQLGTVVVPFGNNKVKLTTNQNPTSTDDIRYSLVGEVGVSRLKKDGKPIKSQLDIAKQLETEGKTSEEIFDETGWEKGADGKWRFDIPDLKLDFDKIDKLGDDGRASLGDLIKNKKTWSTYKRMYPGLEDYSIHFMSDKETTTKGYADVEDQVIMINKAKMDSPEYMNGVLVHEIQHVIQVDEGFALGGTPEDLPYDQGIYDLMMEAHRANMKYNQAPEGSEEKKLLEKERDELDNKYNEATYDMYRRLAGEVDARNAQERTKYEYDLRRYMPISSTEDTPRDKQIVWGTRDVDGRYSLAQPSDALNLYNQEVMKKSFLNREAWQDSMLGLKVLQDAVEKATGKPIKDFENAYMAENSMSSRNLVEMNDFKNHEFKAILDAVKASGFDITDKDQLKAFNDYIMAKHGIERNRYMSVRKAINSDENLSDEDKEAKMAGYRTAIDLIRRKNLPWEQAQKEMDAVAESFGGILGEDFSGLTSVLGIEMENPDGSNKSKDDIRKETYDGAYDLVNASEQSHKTDDLWKAINDATGKTLQTINDGGLISNDSLDFIKGMYDYYIPLKGWEEETAMDMYQYLGEQYGNGNLLKKAEGRISVADDPLATIGNNGLVAISRKNRNLMKQKFLFMVLNHPSNLVKTNRPWAMKDLNDNWVVVGPTFADDATPEEIKEAVDDFEEDMKKRAKSEPDKYKRIAQGTKLPVKIDDRSLRQHQVLVYQNGIPYVMTVTGSPRAAQALNGATNPDVGSKFRQGVTKLTRILASLNTALNPDFVLSNLFRDMGYTHSMLAVKEGSDYAKKYSSNWRGLTLSVNGKLSALKMAGLIKRYENDNLDMSNEDDRLFNEFMKGGGETGYTFVNSIEDYKKIIQDTLKGEKNVLVKAKEAVGNALETFSRWAEDIARFAAYKTSRQMGRSVERSIWDAKEVSVNFNKKGAGDKFTEELSVKEFSHWSGFAAQYGRAYLMFMNAGVQGLNNMLTVAKKSPKKFTAIMAAHALVGALIPLANMLIRSLTGGDDDDYWNQPEYTRQSNITLAIPGTDKYLAIPLAIEMRVFYGLGEMFMDMYKNPKDKTPTQWAWRLAEISAGLLPFDVTGEGGIGKNLAPSIARPILDVNANENWMGLPINRTSFQDYTPKFKLASSYTDKTLISVSKMLNKAIGGSDYTDSGTILDQFNDPAAAQYLFEQYFGGLGQSIGRIIKDMGAAMSGKIGELRPRDLIILNRFVKDASQEQKDKRINTIWFNEKDKMERVNANANGLIRDIKETSDENERARLINELNIIRESPEFAGLKVWKEYNSALNKVSNSDLDDDTKNDLKYAIKKEMVGLVKGDEELVSEGKSELEEIKANRQKIEN